MICDFCSIELTDEYKAFPANDFVHQKVGNIEIASAGDWCACPICAGMVDDEDWANLLVRSVDTFFENNPDLKGKFSHTSVMEQIQELHNQFREARHGKT